MDSFLVKLKNGFSNVSRSFILEVNNLKDIFFLDPNHYKKTTKNKHKKVNIFTTKNIDHNIGDKFLVLKISKNKTDKKELVDLENSFILKCTSKNENQNFYDIKKEDFVFSNYDSLNHLTNSILEKTKNPNSINAGINLIEYEVLDKKIKTSKDFLNENDLHLKSTREGFSKAMMVLGEENEDVIACVCDLKSSLKLENFEKSFPKRFYEFGISEQNMASAAAGISHTGKIVFICSFSAFNPLRNLDQIRVSICYSNFNVKIVGAHSGLLTGEDGATHQCLEDISVMRILPNMTVVVPCDFNETYKATIQISKIYGPCYLRLSRENIEQITKEDDKFEIGKINVLYEKGYDLIIVACGIGCQIAKSSINEFEKRKIKITILNCHTIKPLDEKTLLKYRNKCSKFITIEEHQINGGLGSSISEFFSEVKPAVVKKIGMKDSFGESGKSFELLEKYKISKNEILKKAKEILGKKF